MRASAACSCRCFVVTPPVLLTQIKECAGEELGKGYLVSCLVDHRTNISDYQCGQYITKMTSIIFSDFRLICGFMDKCREDINALHCGSISTGEKVGEETTLLLGLFESSVSGVSSRC